MSSLLPHLPNDILEAIISYLHVSDVLSIRLVCWALCNKSLRLFGREYFTTITTSLSSSSLESLCLLSENEALCANVTTLRVAPRKYLEGNGNGEETWKFGEGFEWPRRKNGVINFPTLGSQEMQEIVLRGFPKCKSFVVQGRMNTQGPTTGELCDTDVVSVVLDLIAQTGLDIQSFKLELEDNGRKDFDRYSRRMIRRPEGVPDPRDKKDLDGQLWQEELFKRGWTRVEELTFGKIDHDKWPWMKELLLLAPNLRNLSLVFGERPKSEWLIEIADTGLQLASFKLENIGIFLARTLIGLLKNSKETLKDLSITNCFGQEAGFWQDLFRGLANDFNNLETLSLHLIRGLPPKDHARTTAMGWHHNVPMKMFFNLTPIVDIFTDASGKLVGWKIHGDSANAESIQYTGREMATVLNVLDDLVQYTVR